MSSAPPISTMDQAYFGQYAAGYSPYTERDMDLILSELTGVLAEAPPRTVCEMGSADGQFSGELAKRLTGKPTLIGIDIVQSLLRRFPGSGVCASAFETPFPAGSIDLVCYPGTLHHLEPFGTAVRELARILSPPGLAFFMEPNYHHPQRRFFMANKWMYHRYRKANDVPVRVDELRSLLEAEGLTTLSLRYVNIDFRKPGLLQRIQNRVSRLPWPDSMDRYVMPWFILVAHRAKR